MIAIACGDRKWANKDIVKKVFEGFKLNLLAIIEGEARGADSIAREVAYSLGIPVLPVPAEWDKYGKPAGPIRNRKMLKFRQAYPDHIKQIIAFHNNIKASIGTRDMCTIAKQVNIPVWVFSERENFFNSYSISLF